MRRANALATFAGTVLAVLCVLVTITGAGRDRGTEGVRIEKARRGACHQRAGGGQAGAVTDGLCHGWRWQLLSAGCKCQVEHCPPASRL